MNSMKFDIPLTGQKRPTVWASCKPNLTCPQHFSKRARAIWASIHSRLELTTEETELLRIGCENLDLADLARATLRREGLTVGIDGACKRHPAADMAKQHDGMTLRVFRQLALDIVKPQASSKHKGER